MKGGWQTPPREFPGAAASCRFAQAMTPEADSRMKGMSMAEDSVTAPRGPRNRALSGYIVPDSTVNVGGSLSSAIAESNLLGQSMGATRECPCKDHSGWKTAAFWTNRTNQPVTLFRAVWKVPRVPACKEPQLLYLFNGMVPAKGSPLNTILQPVLQWGEIWQHWSVASWINPDSTESSNSTPPVKVKPGQTLVGLIKLQQVENWLFTYSCEFDSIDGTRFYASHMPELVCCVEALEAYRLTSSSQYPEAKRTRFRRIHIAIDGIPIPWLDWVPRNYVTTGEHTEIVSTSSTKGRVDIYYGAATGMCCVGG
jgi:hypothetical protein